MTISKQWYYSITVILFTILMFSHPRPVLADWPTYRGDERRSGVVTDELKPPLVEVWKHRSAHAPSPAWPELPATQDVWHRIYGLGPTTTYDRSFHTVIVGGAVYYGSSTDDTIYCLDAVTGEKRWSFTTEGPVRLAPTVVAGKVYAGSDDGYLYCLNANDGQLVWRYRGGPEDRRLPGNGRLISLWPVRCGIVVDNGVVYFCAGLFPTQENFLCAVNAANGTELWKQKINISSQGYMLASSKYLFVPTGRTTPQVYNRTDGTNVGPLSGSSTDRKAGSCFAVVVDDMVLHGAGEAAGIQFSTPGSQEKIIFADGLRVVTAGQMNYILTKDRLYAMDRTHYLELNRLQAKKEKTDADKKRIAELGGLRKDYIKWDVPCSDCYELILAGHTIFAGTLDRVTAYNIEDGKQLWTGTVAGKVYGLAVSDGYLYVSTDKGIIHCFKPEISPVKKDQVVDVPDVVIKPSPYPLDEQTKLCSQVAEIALKLVGTKKGYCLVLGTGTGRLAYEIAQQSQMQVVCVDSDASRISSTRKLLADAGLYGTRISIHQGDLNKLPYQKNFANLIVSEETILTGKLSTPATEVYRVLRPCNGTVMLIMPQGSDTSILTKWGRDSIPDWKVKKTARNIVGFAHREPLPGAGEWSHFHADPGNTACSGDTLPPGKVDIQWFGRPGPRRMPDRHDKNVGPLYKNGRLFVSGDNYVVAIDAYNGAFLWERNVPDSVRLGAFKHSGNMAAADDELYVASGSDCIALDAQTGQHRLTLSVPANDDGSSGEWGYIATVNDLLVGSTTKPGAAFREQTIDTEVLIWRDLMPVVCSDAIFACKRHSGKKLWSYASQRGVIINPTIAIGGGRIYFVESTNPETRSIANGRIKLPMLLSQGADLVSLDLSSGKILWRKPAELQAIQNMIFLSYARERLVITGTKNAPFDKVKKVRYDLLAFDAVTGKQLWQNTQTPIPDHILQGPHGEQVQHSAIVGDVIYNTGFACNLNTGEPITGWKWQKSPSCGTLSTSAKCAFSRFNSARMFNLKTGEYTDLTGVVRPGCWINIIPAGGLILMPEASAGCICGYSIQTSIALTPVNDHPAANKEVQ